MKGKCMVRGCHNTVTQLEHDIVMQGQELMFKRLDVRGRHFDELAFWILDWRERSYGFTVDSETDPVTCLACFREVVRDALVEIGVQQ